MMTQRQTTGCIQGTHVAHTLPVGRFAPTPSGHIHLGNAFSSLIAWASVRSQHGRMVLRIEDIDPRAQDRRVADDLMRDYEWLGLDWDEGPYFQSDRLDIYEQAVDSLTARGLTYPCFCTRSELHSATAPHASDGTFVYQGTCRHLTADQVREKSKHRHPATRLKVPDAGSAEGQVTIRDRVYGDYHEDLATDCGDFLIRRSDGVFAYQLVVVVDDGLMGVNEVVRGRDLLPSSARQTYLARLLHLPEPSCAHVPLLVAPDGRRLSKRDRDTDISSLREAGISAEAIVGRLANLIGLAERGEAISAEEFANRFTWDAVRHHKRDVVVTENFFLE
ncbi:MAG: tRNA glutamyl-Q(34) synthetase GluQRS [Coriobacteriaceae bacterium]|nr:MAG: tRNA glutamyl-Q(34) synthetase GluQRS [Coriobacteriaceae bacterium]